LNTRLLVPVPVMAFGVPRQAMPPRVIMPVKAGAATMRVSEAMRGISLQYDHKDLSDATLNWSKSRQLGSGSYGAVFKGEMKDGTQVAIKMIDLGALKSSGQTEDMAGFDQEVATLSKFRHPNLVTLIGWGKHYELPHRYLVYELMTGGDIYDRLLKSRKRQNPVAFHWYERLSALLDAASGLSHMHNSKPEAFHRDIKSANILLDRHGTAKMADFGLSITSKAGDAKSCKVDTISGTPGYACPIYARTGQVTEFSEVYSFGMVILEVLTAIPPAMADNTKPGGIGYPIEDRIKPGFDGALARCVQLLDHTASWPPGLPEELSSLGIRCVNATDETKRPRFVEVVRALRAMQDKYPTPAGGPAVAPGYGGYAVIPEGDSQGSGGSGLAGMQSVPYMLELVRADDIEVERLPAHKRRLHLFPSLDKASGRYVAPVGRQHQPDLFESWLSNEELRSCISRLAFEVSWVPSGDAKITARGNNPVTLNDQILTRNQPMALRIGSEIGFPYSQTGELALFLQLRLAPATLDSATNAAAVAPTAVLDFGEVDRATSSQSWALHCSFVEGLNDEELSDLPGSVTEFKVEGDAPLVIGRQHQAKEFERLLSKASACMSFISRAHVQLEVQNDALLATNISNNPVYVDKKPLSRGESRRLCPNQVISFARLEGSTHVLFISFEAILVDQSAAKTKAVR